ncbi:MAG: hypothetical protein FWE33_01465 [Defluviitaleaceae bacterium]|nr:hypothetical protein [Defluviitaleaceae bacterium]
MIKDGIELIKSIAEVKRMAGKLEDYKMLIKLNEDIISLQQENSQLRRIVGELESRVAEKNEAEYHNGQSFITFKNDEQTVKFCAECWANEEKRKPLVELPSGYYKCNHCNNGQFIKC